MMEEMNAETPITIIQQGAPRVNVAWIKASSETVAAIFVDLHSKRCDIDDLDGQIRIRAIPEISLHLDDAKPVNSETVIAFPEFAGWEVFLAEISRYTLRVCLVKAV